MTHWRQRRDDYVDKAEIYDALAAMLFWIVITFPFLTVWLVYVIYAAN